MPNFAIPAGRQPRGIVHINGSEIVGWIDAKVNNNSYFSSDTFSVTLATSKLPADKNRAWFCSQQDMYVEIFIGMPPDPRPGYFGPGDLKSWIYGQVDDIDYAPAGKTITITGRDVTRLFIDNKTTQKWPNLTSSQIATHLAQNHGLDTANIKATTVKAGKFYEIDHVNIHDNRSEWDLLNFLAEAEDFLVYVRGTSLHFEPKPNPNSAPIYELVWNDGDGNGGAPAANFEDVIFRRALTVARGIQVVIKSWNKKHAKGFMAKYPGTAKSISVGKSSIGAGAQIYSKIIPNMDQQQANQYAKNWYNQLVAHEMKMEGLTMPGDNSLDITSIISLTGTGTAFDQLYYPNSISRSISFEGGYEMTVNAKNHSPDSDISAL